MQAKVQNIKDAGKSIFDSANELYNIDINAQPKELAETDPETSLYYCLSEAMDISNRCTKKSRELSLVITKIQEAIMWAAQMP